VELIIKGSCRWVVRGLLREIMLVKGVPP
jgi:hypothetical protein